MHMLSKQQCVNKDYSWWRHQMETFSALLVICAGNSPVPSEFPHKGQWHGALMFSLICVWINGWVSNREAGDLRRYRAHYDVIVMLSLFITHWPFHDLTLCVFSQWRENSSSHVVLMNTNGAADVCTVVISDAAQHESHLSREPWWRHQVKTFSALLALCTGNSPVLMSWWRKGPRHQQPRYQHIASVWLQSQTWD